ncbi:MAG: cytochrome c peroxidase [Pseudomonadota bacterium]
MTTALFGLWLAAAAGIPAVTAQDIAPVTDADYPGSTPAELRLGQLLFYDPILSGNRNIACATCHHPRFATGDGLALGLGEGGIGLGPARRADPANLPEQRIPRHAPALFNLGAREFTTLFHDGRIEVDPGKPGGLRTPLGQEMTEGFSGILSAQTMFPVLSPDEMAGHYSENEVSQAVRLGRITGPGGAWDLIAGRVRPLPEYADLAARAYPHIAAGAPLGFTDISNAIAAFMAFEWRSDTSPFDAHLRGTAPLTGAAAAGMALFYGRAGCGDCHAGPFQTDHGFHAMAQPQLGPGKAARFETHSRDIGRQRVTGRAEDAYAFRTPSLRNVTATAPYGHTGAFADLRRFLTHHIDPANAAPPDKATIPLPPLAGARDWQSFDDTEELTAIRAAVGRPPVALTPADIDALLAFLEALSDSQALAGRIGVPQMVPSGLPVER